MKTYNYLNFNKQQTTTSSKKETYVPATKDSVLGPCSNNAYVAAQIGYLEGQMLRNLGASMCVSAGRVDDVINASLRFDLEKSIKSNYSYIKANKDNAVDIANFLCAINWLSHVWNTISDDRATIIRSRFNISMNYAAKAFDFYSTAYEYLNDRFYNDSSISDKVKAEVAMIND